MMRNRKCALATTTSSSTTDTEVERVSNLAKHDTVRVDQDNNNMDDPLSWQEMFLIFTRCFIGPPLVYGPILLLGAYIRTYPDLPTPWFGFYCFLGSLTISCNVAVVCLLDKPRIIRERRKAKMALSKESRDEIQNDQVAKGERIFFIGMMAVYYPSFLYIGYDASIENQIMDAYNYYNYLGAVLTFIGIGILVSVLRTNSYASTMVYKQEGHRIIDFGPYSVVRHPMYGSSIFILIGIPLSAGSSFYGILPMISLIVMLGIRISHEEQFLLQTFGNEYVEYQRRVPYKMFPFIF